MGCVKDCDRYERFIEHLEILISKDNTDESTFEANLIDIYIN